MQHALRHVAVERALVLQLLANLIAAARVALAARVHGQRCGLVTLGLRTSDYAVAHTCEAQVVERKSRRLARATCRQDLRREVTHRLVAILASSVGRSGERTVPPELLRLTHGGPIRKDTHRGRMWRPSEVHVGRILVRLADSLHIRLLQLLLRLVL